MSNAGGIQQGQATYSCHCLNIRVKTSKPKTEPPSVAPLTEFTQIYVAEDGITVVSEAASPKKGSLLNGKFYRPILNWY